MKKGIELEDPTIAAFLQVLGHPITPKFNPRTGRVVFRITGDVDASLKQLYQDNVAIGSWDFVQAIKWWEQTEKLEANPEQAQRQIKRLKALIFDHRDK